MNDLEHHKAFVKRAPSVDVSSGCTCPMLACKPASDAKRLEYQD